MSKHLYTFIDFIDAFKDAFIHYKSRICYPTYELFQRFESILKVRQIIELSRICLPTYELFQRFESIFKVRPIIDLMLEISGSSINR